MKAVLLNWFSIFSADPVGDAPAIYHPMPSLSQSAPKENIKRNSPLIALSDFTDQLEKELRSVGIDAKKAIKLLPEWWREIELNLSGRMAIRGMISDFFGLNFDDAGQFVRSADPSHTAFRYSKKTDAKKLQAAAAFAEAVARPILDVIPDQSETNQFMPSAAELRQEILGKGKDWVGFDDLLEACWSRNIPVIYIPNLPMAGKMDGMVLRYDGKYALVLSKKAQNDHPSRLLFTLAHEMGHVSCQHLSQEQPIIPEKTISLNLDDSIGNPADAHAAQEREADDFAKQLLLGEQGEFNLDYMPPHTLAQAAKKLGENRKIEPGFIILNAAHNFAKSKVNQAWGLAENALKQLDLYQSGCKQLCQNYFSQNIDIYELKDQYSEFLINLEILPREH